MENYSLFKITDDECLMFVTETSILKVQRRQDFFLLSKSSGGAGMVAAAKGKF